DRITAASDHLELMHEGRGVHRLGPSVYFEEQWPLLSVVEARRLDDPAVDGLAVAAGDLERLGGEQFAGLEQRVVFGAESSLLVAIDREDLVRMRRIGDSAGEALTVARCTEGGHLSIAAHHHRGLTTGGREAHHVD